MTKIEKPRVRAVAFWPWKNFHGHESANSCARFMSGYSVAAKYRRQLGYQRCELELTVRKIRHAQHRTKPTHPEIFVRRDDPARVMGFGPTALPVQSEAVLWLETISTPLFLSEERRECSCLSFGDDLFSMEPAGGS